MVAMAQSAWFSAAAALVLLIGASACTKKEQANNGEWRSGIKEVRLAVSGSNDDPRLVKRRAVFQARLSQALGLPVKLYESSDYNGVIQAMSSGQVDLAQMAGGAYANLDSQVDKLAVPILTPRQAEGGTGYYSALVVRADSPIHSLADMKGHSLGYVDFNSTSGYLVPRAKFREQGIDPDTYFGKTSFAGGHTQAVMALANGQFDAAMLQASGGDPIHGFSRGALYTMARRKLVDLKDFRIIWTAGPIPSEAFVVRTDRPQPLIDLVRGAMGAMAYDEPDLWVDVGQLDGSAYTSVNRDHYKDIIALRSADIAQRRGQGGRP